MAPTPDVPPGVHPDRPGRRPRRLRPPRRPALRRFLRSPTIRNNLYYLLGIGGSGAGVLIAQAYAAHFLGPTANGVSTAILALLNLLYTVTFIVAASTARRVSQALSQAPEAEVLWPAVRARAWRLGIVLGASTVPAVPLLAMVLHLQNMALLLVVIVAGPLAALGGAQRGFLQGTRDFRRLATNFLLYGGLMVAVTVALLHLGLGAASAPIGSVAGATAAAIYPRHRRLSSAMASLPTSSHGWTTAMAVVAGAATAPLFNNFDVIAAKHVLPPHQAGLYAGLSLMGKIVFFGTSSLAAVMYPRVAATSDPLVQRHLLRQAATALATLDAIALLGYTVLAAPLLRVVLGPAYAGDARLLTLFTLGVIALTVVNLLVYYAMAVGARRFALAPALGIPLLADWLFTSPPAVREFVPRIALALGLLAVVELALVGPLLRSSPHRQRSDRPTAAPPNPDARPLAVDVTEDDVDAANHSDGIRQQLPDDHLRESGQIAE